MNTLQVVTDTPATEPGFTLFFSEFAAYIERLNDARTVPTHTDSDPAIRQDAKRLESLARLLLNSWSAEYALRITPMVNEDEYVNTSLHWTFPQAYYSVLFSARAYLYLQNLPFSDEAIVRKTVATAVVAGIYPPSLGFYLSGPGSQYTHHRLTDAPQSMIGFMQNTRDRQINAVFQARQSNLANGPAYFARLSRQVGYTTYFDALSRLRISSVNREVETLNLAPDEVRVFHQQLVTIVSHVNGVHESLIKQAIGERLFQVIVGGLPAYLQEGFLADRHPRNK